MPSDLHTYLMMYTSWPCLVYLVYFPQNQLKPVVVLDCSSLEVEKFIFPVSSYSKAYYNSYEKYRYYITKYIYKSSLCVCIVLLLTENIKMQLLGFPENRKTSISLHLSNVNWDETRDKVWQIVKTIVLAIFAALYKGPDLLLRMALIMLLSIEQHEDGC